MNAVKIAYIKFKLCFITKEDRDVKQCSPFFTPLIFIFTCILALNILTGCGKFVAETSVPEATPTPTTTPTPRPDNGDDRDPILPQKLISTKFIAPTGNTTRVASGASLQAALDSAQPGDTLLLEAGATFTGNFVLKKKTGDAFIVIRSSAPDTSLPAEDIRVVPNVHSSFMPKLVSPNTDPVLSTESGAHHYRFIGVEFTISSTLTDTYYDIISLGGDSTSVDDLPHDLIFDRVYIHGNATASVKRGIKLNSATTAIIDSYISDIHHPTEDTQAICGWNGPGPFKIVNNYLEAAGENVMFGGARATIQNLIPSDIEFRRNYLFKPLSWYQSHATYANRKWAVKNLFEVKNGQRILVDGNIFENNWADAQVGFAILFSVRTEGVMPWAVVKDITFSNNIINHSANGVNILGYDNDGGAAQGITSHIKIFNNLFDDINNSKWGGTGIFVQLIGGPPYIRIIHNTAVNSGHIGMMDVLPAGRGLIFQSNIAFRNQYGFYGSDKGEGNTALNYYQPGATFIDNILIGATASSYPAGNFFPSGNFDLGFRSSVSNIYTPVDTITQRGTDGRKPGVDINAMNLQIYLKTTF